MNSSDARDDPLIGRVIDGKYRLEARLGGGAMGVVYRARQLDADRDVAIKLLRPDLGGNHDIVKRFWIEVQNARRLTHENIVRMFDRGETDEGRRFLVMEYLDGEPFDDLLDREGRLPLDRAINILDQILRSLDDAHANQVVHRDLKPGNIMIVRRDWTPDFVKILDFGLSRALDTVGAGTGVVGTPKYMAPEQWDPTRTVDGRADLYSVGCLAYEMISGRAPFDVDSEAPRRRVRAYFRAHRDDDPTSLAAVMPEPIDPRLDTLVMSMLAKDPDLRPSSAMDALGRLMAIDTAAYSAYSGDDALDDSLESTVASPLDPALVLQAQGTPSAYDPSRAGLAWEPSDVPTGELRALDAHEPSHDAGQRLEDLGDTGPLAALPVPTSDGDTEPGLDPANTHLAVPDQSLDETLDATAVFERDREPRRVGWHEPMVDAQQATEHPSAALVRMTTSPGAETPHNRSLFLTGRGADHRHPSIDESMLSLGHRVAPRRAPVLAAYPVPWWRGAMARVVLGGIIGLGLAAGVMLLLAR